VEGDRRTIAWVMGSRSTDIVNQLYQKVKHCQQAVFYTDNWRAFAQVLPKERHIV